MLNHQVIDFSLLPVELDLSFEIAGRKDWFDWKCNYFGIVMFLVVYVLKIHTYYYTIYFLIALN